MALQKAIQAGGYRGQEVKVWFDKDLAVVVDLTGASIEAYIFNKTAETTRKSDGTFEVLAPASVGIFRWNYGTTDLASPGAFRVQFRITRPAQKDEFTFEEDWEVLRSLKTLGGL